MYPSNGWHAKQSPPVVESVTCCICTGFTGAMTAFTTGINTVHICCSEHENFHSLRAGMMLHTQREQAYLTVNKALLTKLLAVGGEQTCLSSGPCLKEWLQHIVETCNNGWLADQAMCNQDTRKMDMRR
ncbi:hypothetical protein RRG08_016186 [Elysia crispata]|uniref:Uncharacterized protein n=1 Tax=Elysia crispata TaxID=231223 RepID=A0AAE0ZR40_9GAST|nr:hypothetical protein RRG08_016186 [Elysia crispata]